MKSNARSFTVSMDNCVSRFFLAPELDNKSAADDPIGRVLLNFFLGLILIYL